MKYYVFKSFSSKKNVAYFSIDSKYFFDNYIEKNIKKIQCTINDDEIIFNDFCENSYSKCILSKKAKEEIEKNFNSDLIFCPLELYTKSQKLIDKEYYLMDCNNCIDGMYDKIYYKDKIYFLGKEINTDLDIFYMKTRHYIDKEIGYYYFYDLFCSEKFYNWYKKSKMKDLTFWEVIYEMPKEKEIPQIELHALENEKANDTLKRWLNIINVQMSKFPKKMKGIYFNVFTTSDNHTGIEVYGTNRFNKHDDSWASEIDYRIENNSCILNEVYSDKTEEWKNSLNIIKDMICNIIKENNYFNNRSNKIGFGYSDSEIIYFE